MKNVLNINAKLTSIHPLVNGSFSIIFRSKELDRENKNNLLDFYQLTGSLIFAEEEVKKDIIEIQTGNEQSITQRLRARIYSLYEKSDKKLTQEQFYIEKITQIISNLEEEN